MMPLLLLAVNERLVDSSFSTGFPVEYLNRNYATGLPFRGSAEHIEAKDGSSQTEKASACSPTTAEGGNPVVTLLKKPIRILSIPLHRPHGQTESLELLIRRKRLIEGRHRCAKWRRG